MPRSAPTIPMSAGTPPTEQDGTVSTAELGAIELSSQNRKATQRTYRIEATANTCRARAPACPIAAVAASCAFRQAGSAAATVARPFRVTATTRARASSLPVRICTQRLASINARFRVSVVRSIPSLWARSPIVMGPRSISITRIVNCVTRMPCGRSRRSNARVMARAPRRDARQRQALHSDRSMSTLPITKRHIQVWTLAFKPMQRLQNHRGASSTEHV